jgi:hypothetical protein
MREEDAFERFGGWEGTRVQQLFTRVDCELSLALYPFHVSVEPKGTHRDLILRDIGFFIRSFKLTKAELKAGLDAWIPKLGGKLGADEEPGPENPERLALLREELIGERRRDAYDETLARFAPKMARIGRYVRGALATSGRPLPLTFFHSYLHLHLLRLRAAGLAELEDVRLLRLALGAAD